MGIGVILFVAKGLAAVKPLTYYFTQLLIFIVLIYLKDYLLLLITHGL